MMKIGFFFNFEKLLGGGHFWRCLNLAKKLKNTGKEFYFFSNIKDKNFINLLKKNEINYIEIFKMKKDRIINDIIEKIQYYKIKNLIIDSYKIGYFDEKKIKKVAKKLIIIDDYVDRKHFCDLLINNNFLCSLSKKKIKKENPNTKLAIGHKYNIINNTEYKKKLFLKKSKNIKNIFIFFGSSDNTNETSKVLEIVNFFPSIKFNIIIGNFNKNCQKFKKIQKIQKNTKFYFNLDNDKMINLIKKSELAIGAGGINMIERLYFNLPSFVICVADNQKKSTEYLKNQKSIIYLGKSRNVSKNIICNNLKNLIENKKHFKNLQKNTLKISLNLNSNNLIIKKLNSVLIK